MVGTGHISPIFVDDNNYSRCNVCVFLWVDINVYAVILDNATVYVLFGKKI